MTVGKPLDPEIARRIRKAAKENPELSKAALAERFGVTAFTIGRALQNEALPEQLKFPVGTSVKVRSSDGRSSEDRTGVVVDDTLSFPWRDHRRVEFDPMPGRVSSALVPAADLKAIKPSERPESARPREQVEFFGGAVTPGTFSEAGEATEYARRALEGACSLLSSARQAVQSASPSEKRALQERFLDLMKILRADQQLLVALFNDVELAAARRRRATRRQGRAA